VNTVQDEIFGLNIPEHVPGVPVEVLIPRNAWGNSDGYDNEAKKLATSFHENFKKFDEQANDDIKAAAKIYRPKFKINKNSKVCTAPLKLDQKSNFKGDFYGKI